MSSPHPLVVRRAGARAAIALLLAVPLFAGCKPSGTGGPGAAGSAAPASSAAPSGSAAPATSGSPGSSGSAGAAAGAPAGEPKPQGAGVAAFTAVAKVAECQPKEIELGAYLQRGEIAVAARDGGISASWMVQLPNRPDAQIAFGGYDGQAKQTGRVRGVGTSREHAPQVFATGSEWTVTWFDSDGLAFTRPPWDMIKAPTLEHLSAVGKDVSENVGLASTPAGSLVAVAPFGADRAGLGVFLFAPTDPAAPAVKALGVSRHAVKPSRPTVAADEAGYTVTWSDASGALLSSRFDLEGKEVDAARTVAPAGPERKNVSLVPTASGTLVLWTEEDTVVARALDKQAQPKAPPHVVMKGAKWPSGGTLGEGALVCLVGQGGSREGHLLVAKLKGDGAPSETGLEIVGEGHAVKDPPACATAGSRAALTWMEVMSATVSTKRAILRTIEASCIP